VVEYPSEINLADSTVEISSHQFNGTAKVSCIEGYYFPETLESTWNLSCVVDPNDVTVGLWQQMPAQNCTGMA